MGSRCQSKRRQDLAVQSQQGMWSVDPLRLHDLQLSSAARFNGGGSLIPPGWVHATFRDGVYIEDLNVMYR